MCGVLLLLVQHYKNAGQYLEKVISLGPKDFLILSFLFVAANRRRGVYTLSVTHVMWHTSLDFKKEFFFSFLTRTFDCQGKSLQ